MADPKENEEINEELSTDELKSVSGGTMANPAYEGLGVVIRDNDTMLKGNGPEGSGSGKTLKDWKRENLNYDGNVGMKD
ncbi:Hypothetical protein PMT_2324 [Prochlorococcus marinus str. MIT 9313]|uniref:Bacteriocin-type signal sequence n=1 Tax=Prochlorococcus marinus (strain MIT 9313) TaxID=74547 RepID=B9ERF6_PROMM|nr:CCRG-2 family RiPP [Prochlorococcus marinus]CAX31843.1 Hypothetical protein PMT_2324 [Prochlorococcus marinus str. MIT 9313]